MALYENIKALCDDNHIAVTRVESDLGFARGSIGKLRQQKSMSADRIEKIANYFGVTVDYLLTGQHPEHTSTSGKSYYFDDEAAEACQAIYENETLRSLFRNSRKISPKDLEILRNMSEALLRKDGLID